MNEAEASLRLAFRLRPDMADALSDLERCSRHRIVSMRRLPVASERSRSRRTSLVDSTTWERRCARRKFDLAADCFRRAVQLNPRYFDAILNLAMTLIDQEKFADAEAACRSAIALSPKRREGAGTMHRDCALLKQIKVAEAEAEFRRAIEFIQLCRNRSVIWPLRSPSKIDWGRPRLVVGRRWSSTSDSLPLITISPPC